MAKRKHKIDKSPEKSKTNEFAYQFYITTLFKIPIIYNPGMAMVSSIVLMHLTAFFALCIAHCDGRELYSTAQCIVKPS